MSLIPLQKKSYAALMFVIVLILHGQNQFFPAVVEAKSNVYIVYMGEKQHHDLDLATNNHHRMLTEVLGSEEASADSMVYSYRHGFSGFAAKLTESQAQMFAELPEVVQVIPNGLHRVRTTRSWDYLGLHLDSPSGLLHETKMGDSTIIGLLDTGIWPESEVFNDKGLGPIPSRWKGFCESGDLFHGSKTCNRKLIGARYLIKGIEAELGQPFNTTENPEYLSPRDWLGHGTHTSTIAAGSSVPKASHNGLGLGTVRGGAPLARLAMYKVCWNLYGGVCSDVDIFKAIDEAIHDGVDVLSLSISSDLPLFSNVDEHDGISIPSFHAVAKGIPVVCAAGNAGPTAGTVSNTAPWIITVGASTIDRVFATQITLGNKQTIMGEALFTGYNTGFTSLVYPEVSDLLSPRYCETLLPNDTFVAGKVVLCFTSDSSGQTMEAAARSVKEAGGLGVIVARNVKKDTSLYSENFPCIEVNNEIGTQILYYIRSTSDPKVRLSPSKTHVGNPVATKVASFSSRGPSSNSPAILKPDILGPGFQILGAVPPYDPSSTDSKYELKSGTSMATPHVSAVIAMLKSKNPQWSPAAIRSAIVTTAWTTDPYGAPVFAQGEPTKMADPFDFGGGILNPNRASNPGLVYDMGRDDYVKYLCAMGYDDEAISQVTGQPTFCPRKRPSVLDVNLPSITIPYLQNRVSLTRTVTNVGVVNCEYEAVVVPPPGVTVKVRPEKLVFNSVIRNATFTVMVSSHSRVSTGFLFGSLTWSDGVHAVRIPVSVRSDFKIR